MSVKLENRPTAAPEGEKKSVRREKQNARVARKRTMNLYYKPDRTTRPATVALYVLFVAACLLGLAKLTVYDLWMETAEARRVLAVEQDRLKGVMLLLADDREVRERYQRYSATDEERELIDRMEILDLLDRAVGSAAALDAITISGSVVQIQFSGVTLAQMAEIVRTLEASPLVAGTTVNTAFSTAEGAPADESAPVRANALIQLQKEVAK